MTNNYQDLIGAPFKYGGRGPHEFDCYGLLSEMLVRSEKPPLPDLSSPTDQSQIATKMLMQIPFLWEELEKPEAGCALLFRIKRLNSHCGFYLGNDRFIHSWEGSNTGVCVERLSTWERRCKGFFRYAA